MSVHQLFHNRLFTSPNQQEVQQVPLNNQLLGQALSMSIPK